LKNEFLIPRTVSDPIRPEATAHGVRRPAMRGRPKGWLGLGLAARSGGEAARGGAAVRTHDDAVAHSLASRWRLSSGKVLPVSLWGAQGGHRARRLGWGSPEWRRSVEAVEDASGGGVHQWGGSFGGRW
jgi:hypothetical protein